MPRVLICTPSHAIHGGVERIIESLAAGLPQRGFEVVVGLARGTRFHDPDRYRAAYPRLETVEIDGTGGRAADRARGVRRAIERTAPDLVLSARLFDVYPAVAALKIGGSALRLAVTIQAFEPEYIVDAAAYAPFLDLCVTSGNLIARAVERFAAIPPDRVISIPGGVCPAEHPRDPRASRPLRIVYAGRLDAGQKRVLDLPEVLAELHRRGVAFRAAIAGSGPAEAELRRRIADLGVAGFVDFHGWLSPSELYGHVYPDADVLVHLAAWEGVTIAPREAMAHGVVPVISRFAGLKAEGQFVDGVNALTFPVGDVRAAADCIERLDHERGLLERLSSAARESQAGIRSEQGALDAWAEAFRAAVRMPLRRGLSAPEPPRDIGRLDALPSPVARVLRRLPRRALVHQDAGSEWPHWSGRANPDLEEAIEAFARDAE